MLKNLLKKLSLTYYKTVSAISPKGKYSVPQRSISHTLSRSVTKLGNTVLQHPYSLVISLISFYLALANYEIGTWLSGWDTLHPEFNFPLYFKRIFFGAWQEHQGLGAVATQAHAAELPRYIFYWLSSFLLPLSAVRYGFFFFTLFAGSLGMYFFLEKIAFKRLASFARQSLSFAGSMVYLLNLAVLQQYYVPLEMFALHFATLPWLFLTVTNYLEDGRKKSLIIFSLLTVLSSSIAHTATLFYAYLLGLSLYVGFASIVPFSREVLKRSSYIILSTFVVSSFWLLPNLYYVLNFGNQVPESKISEQFSEKAFLTGKKFGDIENTAILKNFLFDWGEYNQKEERFVDLFNEWFDHTNKLSVKTVGYSVFGLVLIGLTQLLLNYRNENSSNKFLLSLSPVFFVSFLLIANNNPISILIFGSFSEISSVLKEALRFPFTKFSILLAFCFAVYASYGLSLIASLFCRFKNHINIYSFVLSLILFVSLVYYMLPAFSGNLISKSMKVNFPQEYFQVFNWFENEEPGRVLTFPMDTIWGWGYYKWQYEGAGFRWFGIDNPLLDREFDRWSPYNENAYNELSYAFYSGQSDVFEKLLEKYQIKYIYVDDNIFNPSAPKSLYLDEAKQMLGGSQKFEKAAQFGKVHLYKVNLGKSVESFVYAETGLPTVSPSSKWTNYDAAYKDLGDYKVTEKSEIVYPFRSLLTGKASDQLDFEIIDKGDHYIFKKTFASTLDGYSVWVPPYTDENLMWVDPKDLSKTQYPTQTVDFDGKTLEVYVSKINGLYSGFANPYETEVYEHIRNCNPTENGYVKNQIVQYKDQKYLRLIASDANNCSAGFWMPQLPHDTGYLISINSRHVEGRSILFWLENLNIRKPDLETFLPKDKNFVSTYLIQPPMEKNGMGYYLHFDNTSIGSSESINDLGSVAINPIPYEFLTGLSLRKGEPMFYKQTVDVSTTHPNPSLYKVEVSDVQEDTTLILSQSYNIGWKAYWGNQQFVFLNMIPFFGKELKEHLLVNNWQNGWNISEVSKDAKITIVFVPQYLQYIGLTLCSLYFVYLMKFKK